MNSLGNTLYVTRGETFVLGRSICKSNGYTPYVLSSNVQNPYIVITVQSDNFRTDKGYKHTFWLDISDYLSFTLKQVVALTTASLLSSDIGYNTAQYCVYEVPDDTQDSGYAYYYSADGTTLTEYEGFIFKKVFTAQETSEWIERQYLYNIKLIGGITTTETLTGLYQSVFPDYELPSAESIMYEQIKKIRPDLVEGIDYNKPIATITTQEVLQRTSKIIVRI